jgi:CheY-like chemotaxis protein
VNKDSILIVDDNRMTRDMLKAWVETSGFTVDTCEDGKNALAIAMESCHAVFLIEYRMPEMTGDKVTALLRALRPDAFIIGFSIEDKERAFLDAGANVFLNKFHLLDNLIQIILSRNIS